MVKETDLNEYFRQVEAALGNNSDGKDDILKIARSDIHDYLEEHPDKDMSDLQKHFGSPADYAKAQLEVSSSDNLRKQLNVADFRKKAICVTAVIVLFIVMVLSIGIAVYNSQHSGRYYDEDIVNISTEPIHEED